MIIKRVTNFTDLVYGAAIFVCALEAIYGQEQNPKYRGPTDCDEVLKNHYFKFSEYPTGPNVGAGTELNFLAMGDTCNHEAETEFLDTMRNAFLDGTENSARMEHLQELWESWRSRSDTGSVSGRRICNPKRMLECHQTSNKCVCRSRLRLFDTKDFVNDEAIALDTVRLRKEIPNTGEVEEVEECRAKVDSLCQWNVPWLGFCAIPCESEDMTTPSYCVGQPSGSKRCRVCDPTTDIGGDDEGKVFKCFQEQHRRRNRAASLYLGWTPLLAVTLVTAFSLIPKF